LTVHLFGKHTLAS